MSKDLLDGPFKGLVFPFLFLGNSGATWRAEKFTDDDGLVKDMGGIPQCECVCVLPGNGVEIGARATMFAYSLSFSYGAHLPEAQMWNPQDGVTRYFDGEMRKFPGEGVADPDAVHVQKAN